jgi:Alcohol dehydrogenase GroES-like domain
VPGPAGKASTSPVTPGRTAAADAPGPGPRGQRPVLEAGTGPVPLPGELSVDGRGGMKAVAVFPGTQETKIVEQESPRLSEPDQVILRMLDIGICGTDKEICSFAYGTPPPGDDYLVIGHESVAEVTEVGSAVSRLRVGDLVVPSVRRPCPHPECPACRSGHQDYCYTGDFSERGIKAAHGYLAEYVVDYERYMNPVPPDLRDIAVLTEPLTIAEKAIAQVSWMGTVNAGPEAFASALRNLDAFRRRWPAAVRTLIAGRYPPEQASELILGRPAGIKSVITFDGSSA